MRRRKLREGVLNHKITGRSCCRSSRRSCRGTKRHWQHYAAHKTRVLHGKRFSKVTRPIRTSSVGYYATSNQQVPKHCCQAGRPKYAGDRKSMSKYISPSFIWDTERKITYHLGLPVWCSDTQWLLQTENGLDFVALCALTTTSANLPARFYELGHCTIYCNISILPLLQSWLRFGVNKFLYIKFFSGIGQYSGK